MPLTQAIVRFRGVGAGVEVYRPTREQLLVLVGTSLMWPMGNLLTGPLTGLGGRPRLGCGLLLIAVAFVIAIFIATR
jgi:hypothetical protein